MENRNKPEYNGLIIEHDPNERVGETRRAKPVWSLRGILLAAISRRPAPVWVTTGSPRKA